MASTPLSSGFLSDDDVREALLKSPTLYVAHEDGGVLPIGLIITGMVYERMCVAENVRGEFEGSTGK